MQTLINLCQVFLWLMTYSVIGWIYESTLCSITEHKPVNRGFLNGPLCPVYGFGALVVIAVFHGRDTGVVELFLSAAVLTTALEYITSYVMEKLFHARWWDYSHYRFQLNGRVCLAGFLAFGAFSVVLMKWVHPFISGLIGRIPDVWLITVSFVLFGILIADCAVTVSGILKLNHALAEIQTALDGFHQEAQKHVAELKKALDEKLELPLDKLGKMRERAEERFENSRFHSDRIQEILARRKMQDRRLMRAFPKLTSTRYNEALVKLREKMKRK